MNAIRRQLELQKSAVIDVKKKGEKRKSLDPNLLTPNHTAYWAEGIGKGGEKAWRFHCMCGEMCSSYENFRYHPVGKMYECTNCSVWSHVQCVLGDLSEDEIAELEVEGNPLLNVNFNTFTIVLGVFCCVVFICVVMSHVFICVVMSRVLCP